MIVLLAIMSGIILYMLLNQRGYQRLDHTRLNLEDEFRDHTDRRLIRLEQAMRQAGTADPDAAVKLAQQLREQGMRGQQALERTSSLMQSQLATLSQRLHSVEALPGGSKTQIVAEGLVETRGRLQDLELELAAEQDIKHRLILRVEQLERHLQALDPEFALQAELSAETTGREFSPGASQFFLSNEKYEQIAEMMIRNADFADICRDLKVSRSEIDLVEAMAFRRSA